MCFLEIYKGVHTTLYVTLHLVDIEVNLYLDFYDTRLWFSLRCRCYLQQ